MNDVGDNTPNLKRLLTLNFDGLVVLVGWEETEGLVLLEEALDNLSFTEDLDRFELMAVDPDDFAELEEDDDEEVEEIDEEETEDK